MIYNSFYALNFKLETLCPKQTFLFESGKAIGKLLMCPQQFWIVYLMLNCVFDLHQAAIGGHRKRFLDEKQHWTQ